MRVDKFLKVSRLIKRRTVANEACDKGRVSINGKEAKPSSLVKVGDILEIGFGEKALRIEITSIAEHIAKSDAASLYRVLP